MTDIERIGLSWEWYWGNGFYQYLLLAATIYLLIFHRKKRNVRQVLAFSACLLFVFLFPLTAKCIFLCIGRTVYWRVLWLLPAIPVISLAATEFLRSVHSRSRLAQTLLLLFFCGIIALSGKDMLSAGNYTRTNNRMKVPDDIAHVANMIHAEAEKDHLDEVLVAGDNYLISYLRVYDPSIHQAYGRELGEVLNHRCYLVYRQFRPIKRNYRKIAKLAKAADCNFVVISVPEKKINRFEQRGYVKIGDVGSYSVFQLEPQSANSP